MFFAEVGIGRARQLALFKKDWNNQFSHGGILRRKRRGRGLRPLSTKEPLHVVFKARKVRLKTKSLRAPHCYTLVNEIIELYARRFRVKIEQLSIQHDHVHMLLRAGRRTQFHDFFRVAGGQIAQRLGKEGLLLEDGVTDTPNKPGRRLKLWLYRPFSRVVRGWRAYRIIRDYIQLNEKEAKREILYRKTRLRGLSLGDWQALWA